MDIQNKWFDPGKSIYLTVDLLLDIKNIITGRNNIAVRKVNVKPYRYDKMYIDKCLLEDKLYLLID